LPGGGAGGYVSSGRPALVIFYVLPKGAEGAFLSPHGVLKFLVQAHDGFLVVGLKCRELSLGKVGQFTETGLYGYFKAVIFRAFSDWHVPNPAVRCRKEGECCGEPDC
jgi:hypothetical protein